jgi:probable phosphoglycerate mutase
LGLKKIYLIRHGQTEFNLRGIVQGSGVDSSLNERGRLQAKAFFEAYRHTGFEKVYTSALRRSIESVESFVQSGMPHEILPGLNEISWGNKEGKLITASEDAYYHHMLAEWQRGQVELRIEGGESPLEVQQRLVPAIERIRSGPESRVLVCMHGRAMRILLCTLLGYPLRCMDLFEHENLCLYRLAHTGSLFSVELYNDTSHLNLRPR